LRRLTGNIRGERLPRRQAQISAANQMHVQVENCLPGPRAYVKNGAVAVFNSALACNLRRSQMTPAHGINVLSLRLFQAANMLLWDYQNMGRRLRIDVLKRVCMSVFVNFFCGNLALDNAAKQTIIHGASSSSS